MGIAYSSLVFLPPAPIYDAAWDRYDRLVAFLCPSNRLRFTFVMLLRRLRWAACSQKRRIPYFIEEYHGADKYEH